MGGQHLLGMQQLDSEQINAILSTAQGFLQVSRRTIKKVPSLRGRTIITLFYEASTRTRMSFELAGKRLSADTVNISASGSSVSKGESLHDTVMTLNAMQPDAVIVRHPASGAAAFIANRIDARVLNAGDGQHEHPSQALLDMLTIRQRFGKLEGLKVAIVGDIAHSRVARSNLIGLAKMGAQVRVAAPKTLLPRGLVEAYQCTICPNVEAALEGADVVMALRLQRERMEGAFLPNLREYAIEYGISTAMLDRCNPDGILMHPGPVNRGVELSPEVVDGPRSVILDQVENGVAVRMALLYLILGGEPA
ncbi:MAG: aspartate carbamoyltransferase [Deltaproteobacteria bacterium RIFOXYA12_FULL_58_15]|nr:MAG: aspartate carbamoyltransferase [Deltaproteobacteria bacterium RIFOXYA12_FULL_58_15]OGR09392.1 MAG: aspartate carbamoyltransferase [Deltaproteobacteria bacterium RIFOXYB12_FULL_58_9]